MKRTHAFNDLAEYAGRTIVSAEHAREVASAFGVELQERAGELQPIKEMDRLSDDDALGIGVGSLVETLVERLGYGAESGDSVGHGSYQDELKRKNLPALARAMTQDRELIERDCHWSVGPYEDMYGHVVSLFIPPGEEGAQFAVCLDCGYLTDDFRRFHLTECNQDKNDIPVSWREAGFPDG